MVERIFGVSKRRFPVLCTMRPCSFEFQTDIVQCCFLLHNFVHLNQSYEGQFYDDDGNLEELVLDDGE